MQSVFKLLIFAINADTASKKNSEIVAVDILKVVICFQFVKSCLSFPHKKGHLLDLVIDVVRLFYCRDKRTLHIEYRVKRRSLIFNSLAFAL